jgi:hypothetical protein
LEVKASKQMPAPASKFAMTSALLFVVEYNKERQKKHLLHET